ncbi:MAG: formylglycine-generating enzyme family protein [Pseudonocardiaceae bacterium]
MTTPVGIFPDGESTTGCLDMAGNVFEWTTSVALPYPRPPLDTASDGPEVIHICRGGSWRHTQIRARTSYRGRGQRFVRNDDVGFRLARSGWSQGAVVVSSGGAGQEVGDPVVEVGQG